MRLIDADKTKVYTYELDKQVFVDVITRFISLQPTVEAIPVEWIEEYIKSLVIKRRLLAKDGYRDNRCYDYMFGIIGMLDDWDKEIREKENDKMS